VLAAAGPYRARYHCVMCRKSDANLDTVSTGPRFPNCVIADSRARRARENVCFILPILGRGFPRREVRMWAIGVRNDREDANAGDHGGRRARANLCDVYEITAQMAELRRSIGRQ
jgi:hypothetical protein